MHFKNFIVQIPHTHCILHIYTHYIQNANTTVYYQSNRFHLITILRTKKQQQNVKDSNFENKNNSRTPLPHGMPPQMALHSLMSFILEITALKCTMVVAD